MKAATIRFGVSVLLFGAVAMQAAPVRRVLRAEAGQPNLLRADAWHPWEEGFATEGGILVCANGEDTRVQRGAGQTVVLNQTRPNPIVATAWSRAEGVTGSANSDYSLYLDILYTDGTPQWGQTAPFRTGTHDWEKRQVLFVPAKPVKQVSFYLLLRRHGGTAWFREPELREMRVPDGCSRFDAVPVQPGAASADPVLLRDVAADSDFLPAGDAASLGLDVQCSITPEGGAERIDLTVADTTGRDRAVVVYYRIPVPAGAVEWLADPHRREAAEPGREYLEASRFAAGANGNLSLYPFAAVAAGDQGLGLGFDPDYPAFGRIVYNHDTRELFVACDLGLTPEKPAATLRFRRFPFAPEWGFRAALAAYMAQFPEAFRSRTPRQGMWMPFAKISAVEGWQDFGFLFKEGDNETAWDDANGILTFRYTEPMTWWMRMPKELPRDFAAAIEHAAKLAEDTGKPHQRQAQALQASGFHDEDGQLVARFLDTPWCDGAVWSMNSMPGIPGEVTDFTLKWNPRLVEKLYGPDRQGDLDGEYVDSSEGYVTAELDYRRDHFAVADRPLTFALDSHKPAIFRSLVAFEYVRGIERDIHRMDKLMMANSTPIRLWWLAPLLDVLGTETNWHPNRTWRPMSHSQLVYRRALCGPKPYCFLMNTNFEDFGHELVEKYMRRAVAYGMFPGFFSADASTGHYFTRPELYNRDRDLFRRYVPLCKRLAEAGWQPVTRARTAAPDVYLERFGDRYLTVFNDAAEARDIDLEVTFAARRIPRDLLGTPCTGAPGRLRLRLGPEELAVLDFGE